MRTPLRAEFGSPGLPKDISIVYPAAIALFLYVLSSCALRLCSCMHKTARPLFCFHRFASYSSLLNAESKHKPLAFSVIILILGIVSNSVPGQSAHKPEDIVGVPVVCVYISRSALSHSMRLRARFIARIASR